jgi:hypothetical protein
VVRAAPDACLSIQDRRKPGLRRAGFSIGMRRIAACRIAFDGGRRCSERVNLSGRAASGQGALVPRGKRQQGDIPGLLDGAGETALVGGANASEPARHNLAALGHKPLQQPDIAVGDGVNLLGTELADLLAAEELSAAAGST